jgi:hypothetical protein
MKESKDVVKNNIVFYGKVNIKTYWVRNCIGEIYELKIKEDGTKLYWYFRSDRDCFSSTKYFIPEYSEIEGFLKYEKLPKDFDMKAVDIEKTKMSNKETQYFLDVVIRVEESPEAKKFAEEFFKEEMLKFETNTMDDEDKTKKDKKWYNNLW